MCKADPLYHLNVYGFTYDPRKEPSEIPFITYPYQDKLIADFHDAIRTGEDLVIAKSRDMGATWLLIAVFLHRWQFGGLCSFLLGSRKEEYVDGDARSLMWKADRLLQW